MTTLPRSHPRHSAAHALHAGGGVLFPFRHGYERLGQILDELPGDAWRQDEAVLGGVVLWLVKQGHASRAKSYLRAVDLEFEKTDTFTVLDLLLALHLGEVVSEQQLRTWRRLERSLPINEPLLLGLYFNAMMAMHVRLGNLTEARVAGQQAISCYREANHVYLEHFIYIHLADLDVIEGRLHRAQRSLVAAERCLAQSGQHYRHEEQVISVIRLAIDYERGELARVRARAAELRGSLVRGDSWSELFYQLARIAVLSAYFLEGREAAMQELGDFQADYARRHGGEAQAMEALKALIWHLEWQPDAAERTLDRLRSERMQSALGTVLVNELEATMGLHAPGPAETPRARIVAALQQARTARGSRRLAALERALRIAFDEGQIAPFLEHRDVFMGLSATLLRSERPRGQGQLGRMTNRVLRMVTDSYVIPESLRVLGFNRRQYRVAAALISGATNKQIARQLGTTEATVKYHVTALYRMMGVRRRRDFIDSVTEIYTFP